MGRKLGAYYNENDPFCVDWLRNLIRKGKIASGDVDSRSIAEVTTQEVRGYVQAHFFAGVGVWSYALKQAGWSDDRPIWTGSCPCQPFSSAGKRKGFSDERHLWPVWQRLIDRCQPPVVVGEQIANPDGLVWLDVVLSELEAQGYATGAADLAAAGAGAPHRRQRLFFVADRPGDGRGEEHEVSRRRPQGDSSKGRGSRSLAGGDARDLAESGCERRDGKHASLRQGKPRQEGLEADGHGEARGVATPLASEADRTKPRLERHGQAGGELGYPDGRAGSRNSGAANRPQITTAGEGLVDWDLPDETELTGAARRRRLTQGFWKKADWLYHLDGKYRPVEPGTFPLVNGATNRVGRLRGYGNALCAQVAETFVRAYMQARDIV